MRIFLVACLLMVSVASADLEQWETKVQKNGLRTAHSVALATTPNGNFPATLSIECQPGSGGTISLIYTVNEPAQIIQFPFDDFEGPDAPMATKKLGQIQLRTKTSKITLEKELAGYYATPQTFAFSISVPAGQKNEVTQLLERIIQGAATMSFCVLTERWLPDAPTPIKICSDFILKDSEKKIAETVKPCL